MNRRKSGLIAISIANSIDAHAKMDAAEQGVASREGPDQRSQRPQEGPNLEKAKFDLEQLF
jgi:hypothetical protein